MGSPSLEKQHTAKIDILAPRIGGPRVQFQEGSRYVTHPLHGATSLSLSLSLSIAFSRPS